MILSTFKTFTWSIHLECRRWMLPGRYSCVTTALMDAQAETRGEVAAQTAVLTGRFAMANRAATTARAKKSRACLM